MNNLKTVFLLTLLTLLAVGVGDYFGGQNGMILGFAIAGITNFISYFFSDKIALAMYRAQSAVKSCRVSIPWWNGSRKRPGCPCPSFM
jgi:heat shock protein HtpX